MKLLIIWILAVIAINGEPLPTEIPCQFSTSGNAYTCRLPMVDLNQFERFVITTTNHLPGQSNGTVQSFVSVHNNFQAFPTEHLAKFPNLVSIKITGSNISELPAQSIANRPLLESLNLNSNSINRIDQAAFSGTPNIRNFQMVFNKLTTIDNAAFGPFTQLSILDLSSNMLTSIPENTLRSQESLDTLSLNANKITFIHRNYFNNHPNLERFNFMNNLCYSGSFADLTTQVGRNEKLRRLQPCFNDGPRQLTCTFGYNFPGINSDGRYACLLRNIELLNYQENIELTGFHLAGRTNTNVSAVLIDTSNVRYIMSQVFTTFSNLEHLQVQSSNLETLQPGAFQGANNLKELTISLNAVRRLQSNSFQHATNLEIINLYFNSLEIVDERAFNGLVNLKELHLYAGHLEYIPPYTFYQLRSLYLVEIGQNKLKTIDHRWFTENPLIGQLLFNSNEINEIFPEIVDMPNLTTLRLLNNTCVDNEFTVNNQTREQIRLELNTCFENYPLRIQRFEMEVEGSLTLMDEDGEVVIQI